MGWNVTKNKISFSTNKQNLCSFVTMALQAMIDMKRALQLFRDGVYEHARTMFENSFRGFDDNPEDFLPSMNRRSFSTARCAIQLLVSCVVFKAEPMRHIAVAEQILNMITFSMRRFLDDYDQQSELN